MDNIYDSIITLKKQLENELKQKAKELDKLNILNQQYHRLKNLLEIINEWSENQ